MGFPIAIFNNLPPEKQQEIFAYASVHGNVDAAKKYCEEIGMTYNSLYIKLTKHFKKDKDIAKVKAEGTYVRGKYVPPARELTPEDQELLNKFESGEVTLEEMSRKISRMAFERMLLHPEQVRYHDFIKTELLKIKQQEVKLNEKWGNELLLRMFAGKLPPPVCPECGHSFVSTKPIEGEVLKDGDGSLSLTESI